MSTLDSIQSTLASKAGHPPAPEVEVGKDQEPTSSDTKSIEDNDHVGVVLQHAPIDDDLKADLWDTVYNAKSSDDLDRNLKSFDIPPHVVAALVVAKRLLDTEQPAPSHADKIKTAAQHMADIDPKLLDLMEAHPGVLKHLLNESSKKD